MAKMKYWKVFKAGSVEINGLYATCITKACKKFIETLEKPAKYELYSTAQAHIRYIDNHCIMGDYVIMEA